MARLIESNGSKIMVPKWFATILGMALVAILPFGLNTAHNSKNHVAQKLGEHDTSIAALNEAVESIRKMQAEIITSLREIRQFVVTKK